MLALVGVEVIALPLQVLGEAEEYVRATSGKNPYRGRCYTNRQPCGKHESYSRHGNKHRDDSRAYKTDKGDSLAPSEFGISACKLRRADLDLSLVPNRPSAVYG